MSTNTITLPGGIILTLPANLPGVASPSASFPPLTLPFTLPNLPAGNLPIPPDQLIGMLTPLLSAIPGVGPFAPLIGALLGVIFHIGQGIHTQATTAGPTGSNPSIDAALQHFFTTLTTAFPLPQFPQPQPPAPAAG